MQINIQDTGTYTKQGTNWNTVRNASDADNLDDDIIKIISQRDSGNNYTIKRSMIIFPTSAYSEVTTADLNIPLSLVQGNSSGTTIQLFNSQPNSPVFVVFSNQWDDHFNYPTPFSDEVRVDFNDNYTIPLSQYAIDNINQNSYLYIMIVEKEYDYQNITPPKNTKVGVEVQNINLVNLEVFEGNMNKPIGIEGWEKINEVSNNNVEKINI